MRPFSALLLLAGTDSAYGEPSWNWRDKFSLQEKRELRQWITRTASPIEDQVGPYPFTINVHFYRREGRGEPVPWAKTRRPGEEGVNFYVDPSFSLNTWLSDWTAPHELSHLLIPYVGREHSWFAEGGSCGLRRERQYPALC